MKILLIDDHAEARQSVAGLLQQLGHSVEQAANGQAGLEQVYTYQPALILSDMRMPGMDGLHLLEALESCDHPPPLALMTAFGDAETAIRALRLGAIDYIRKPIDVNELNRLLGRLEPREPSAEPSMSVMVVRQEADGLVVCGSAFAHVVALADRLHDAPDLPCLIEGETGSGKELIARRIHHGGYETSGPFIALNCAAIAPGLFESELFGYSSGAFTGALATGSVGKLALAAGGTILLDEIADLPADQQAKLLRIIEERNWYPVGSNQLQRLKARVICSCNADLLERVRSGRFREDLYYRLKVGHLRIPPLRERDEDNPPLARAYLMRIRLNLGRGFVHLHTSAERALRAYPWPGNVRQLYHLLEQASVFHDGEELEERHLIDLLPRPSSGSGAPRRCVLSRLPGDLEMPTEGLDIDSWTKALVIAALDLNHGSPVRTASYLGVTRKVLYTLRKRYGLLGGHAEGDV